MSELILVLSITTKIIAFSYQHGMYVIALSRYFSAIAEVLLITTEIIVFTYQQAVDIIVLSRYFSKIRELILTLLMAMD
jgi:hypothetical protein